MVRRQRLTLVAQAADSPPVNINADELPIDSDFGTGEGGALAAAAGGRRRRCRSRRLACCVAHRLTALTTMLPQWAT